MGHNYFGMPSIFNVNHSITLFCSKFFNNSVKTHFVAMKLLDFSATTYYATSHKVSLKYFETWSGRQFSGTDPGKVANSQISIITKKGAEFEYFANFFCNVVLFDVFYHHYHVWVEIVLQM